MFVIGPQTVKMASNMTMMVAVEAAASTCVFSKTFANHRSYRLDRFSVLELVNPGRRQTHASTIRRSVSVRQTAGGIAKVWRRSLVVVGIGR